MPEKTFLLKYSGQFFYLIGTLKSFQNNWFQEINCENVQIGKNNAKLNKVPSKFSPSLGEIDGKMISTWNLGI